MSLASDYAAAQAQVAADQVTANVAEPPQLFGPNATFSVTVQGNMLVVRTNTGPTEVPPESALALAAWITATFG